MEPCSNEPNTNAWLAGLLSFLIPGLGQVFNRRIFAGLLWFITVGIGYFMFFVPGVTLHILCVVFAFAGGTSKRKF